MLPIYELNAGNSKMDLSIDVFRKIEKDIGETLKKSPLDFELKHAELVLKWVVKIKPDANKALQIAALAHDIDRGITGILERDLKDYSQIDEFKKQHALRSAKFIAEILERHNCPSNIINKVKNLVENHETGGDFESDVLRDADSIAYFEHNIPGYMKINGEERTEEKIQFMYKRMSQNAKRLVGIIEYKDEKIGILVKEAISQLS